MSTSTTCRRITHDANPYPANSDWRRKQREHGEVSVRQNYAPLWRSYSQEKPIRLVFSHPKPAESTDEAEFNRLVEEWKHEVRSKSLMMTIAMHPAYQQMMGMGQKILPSHF